MADADSTRASREPQVPASTPAWRFPAEVRFHNARQTVEVATPAIDADAARFDLSACEHFDSSLIAVLLELERRAAARGRRCRFDSPSENLLKLAALYNVDELLFERAFESALAEVRASALPVR